MVNHVSSSIRLNVTTIILLFQSLFGRGGTCSVVRSTLDIFGYVGALLLIISCYLELNSANLGSG